MHHSPIYKFLPLTRIFNGDINNSNKNSGFVFKVTLEEYGMKIEHFNFCKVDAFIKMCTLLQNYRFYVVKSKAGNPL